MSADARQPDLEKRLLKALRFVAVVWAIGIAYKLLEHGENLLTQASFDSGVLDSSWSVPDPSDPRACAEAVADVADRDVDATTRRRAWDLGVDLGRRRAWRVERAFGEEPYRLSRPEGGAALAAAAGVPVSAAPEATNPAAIYGELTFHLVEDPDCVAAILAAAYDSAHGELYRFGAVVGQAVSYRELGLTQVGGFAELRHYGETARVPAELWSALARRPASDDPESGAAEAGAVVSRIEGWLASG